MTIKFITRNDIEWAVDDNNNRYSFDYLESKEKAVKALESLEDCYDCVNCQNCVDCYDCHDCVDCYDCHNCYDCVNCVNCRDCRDRKKELKIPIPKIDKIHQKIYKASSAKSSLDMSSWHTCDTTHCRAGWVVHLAGKEGYILEKIFTTPLAASMIYRESSNLEVCMPDFYDTDERALDKMKELADKERLSE